MNDREKLYKKVENEFKEYIDNLKELPFDRIIEKSYETTIKDEFKSLCYHEFNILSDNDIKFLQKQRQPLQTLYDCWLDSNANINELLSTVIENELSSLKQIENNRKNKIKDKER